MLPAPSRLASSSCDACPRSCRCPLGVDGKLRQRRARQSDLLLPRSPTGNGDLTHSVIAGGPVAALSPCLSPVYACIARCWTRSDRCGTGAVLNSGVNKRSRASLASDALSKDPSCVPLLLDFVCPYSDTICSFCAHPAPYTGCHSSCIHPLAPRRLPCHIKWPHRPSSADAFSQRSTLANLQASLPSAPLCTACPPLLKLLSLALGHLQYSWFRCHQESSRTFTLPARHRAALLSPPRNHGHRNRHLQRLSSHEAVLLLQVKRKANSLDPGTARTSPTGEYRAVQDTSPQPPVVRPDRSRCRQELRERRC